MLKRMAHQVNVGVASFGLSGRVFHLPLLACHQGFRVAGIVERSTNEAEKKYPQVTVYRSFEAMIQNPQIELVVINTPDATHFDLTSRALDAGKHVVVEKPYMQSVAQCAEVARLSERRRRKIFVFQNRRWDGDFLTVRKVIQGGRLGPIVEFEANWDRYRNFIQPQTWKEERSTGAELLYNLGSHLIDQALVLFGHPGAVTAHLGIVRPAGRVSDWFDVRLHYPSTKVSLRGSYLACEPAPRYVIHGQHGSFVKQGIDPQEKALAEGELPTATDWGKEEEEWWGILHTEKNGNVIREKHPTERGRYLSFYDSVYDSITSGAPCAVTPEEATNVIRVIAAAIRSHDEMQTVPLTQESAS